MADQSPQSLLIARLHSDYQFARQAGFALFALTYLRQIGLAPAERGLADAVASARNENPHLFASFCRERGDDRLRQIAALDPDATQELAGWLEAQHLDREEPQIAYELGVLALGAELPPILVRGLRELELEPATTVAEVPDGSGYAAVFLSTLHPHWQPVGHATLYVEGVDAEQLAGWAMLLLSKTLVPPPGSIVRISAGESAALRRQEVDLALIYNPVQWIGQPEQFTTQIRAARHVLL